MIGITPFSAKLRSSSGSEAKDTRRTTMNSPSSSSFPVEPTAEKGRRRERGAQRRCWSGFLGSGEGSIVQEGRRLWPGRQQVLGVLRLMGHVKNKDMGPWI